MLNVNICFDNDAILDLEQDFVEVLPDGYEGFSDINELSRLGIDALLREIVSIVEGRGGEILSFFLLAFGASCLIWLASTLTPSLEGLATGGVCCAVSVCMFGALYPLFISVSETLRTVSEFFSTLLPILNSFLALGGGVNASVGASSGMMLTVWLVGSISGELLLPVVSAVFATSAVSAAYGGTTSKIAEGIKKTYVRLIGFIGVVVAAVFALQTYISVSADGISIRAAKFAASGLVPVVGSTVSGALATLVGGLSTLGGIIGASSVAVIVAMSLSPLVILLLYKLALFLCSTFLDFAGKGRGVSCISAFSGALDALIAVYSMTVIVYVFEIVLIIWGGNSIYGGA